VTTAIYLRVSSQSQDIRSQEPDLQTWARAQAEDVVWFKDRFTGTQMTRPGLDKLLADARAGKINKVVVWRLDRLGRTARGLLALLDELVALKVNFVSLKDGIDLGTPAGRLIANVLASVAAYETEVRAERIAAGKAAKAARIEAIIKAGGTPPVVNKGGRPRGIPNKVTPTVATMILQMKAEKKKIAVIARELNLSRQTVYDVLRRA
jgi:DNA invertase Pin-like site-specific DNA recombinase